jgi:hypothetical protein
VAEDGRTVPTSKLATDEFNAVSVTENDLACCAVNRKYVFDPCSTVPNIGVFGNTFAMITGGGVGGADITICVFWST